MGEFAVVLTLVGASVAIVAVLLGVCRLLGGWSYIRSWVTGSTEETAGLTKSEHFNINGYQVSSTFTCPYECTQWKDNRRVNL